jgi:hypothetical protein
LIAATPAFRNRGGAYFETEIPAKLIYQERNACSLLETKLFNFLTYSFNNDLLSNIYQQVSGNLTLHKGKTNKYIMPRLKSVVIPII